MKPILHLFGAIAVAISMQAQACTVLLQNLIQLPPNTADVSNGDRLSLTRHYLTAREWTTEGASAQVEAAAFNNELNPEQLAAQRGKNIEAFLMQLGLSREKIHVHERVIELNNGMIDPGDKWQIGVEFRPNCPPSGCDDLCSTPNPQGVAAPSENGFTCGGDREPANTRILKSSVWTERTQEKSLILSSIDSAGNQEPLANTCYRVTTSAREYIGTTDDKGRTARIQLLGPERTRIETKGAPR
ncbi:hypothetical protein BTH42_29130 [Burkholderia sp. SRS-W-2-2016]|uniref:hypothetical protein n=1 Tax=Burkholderia sp. SRS-W-2-2016 TaxID=1926878 RepID=UPI00094AD24C|nr:hypothetical protein [Burkholderia sp. SRS-W-2-2016]OLL28043.1 hypothetical protein BTH42_29130 [Burkholderia sp. SRS-W-2-2016]